MTKHVFLCDDEIAILRAAEFKLKVAGLHVRCASNGEDAWQEIERACPDLVVTDLQMPRLDGFGLCRRIRENPLTRHLPVSMLTAKGFELSPAESTEKYGIAKLMVKPFSPRELLRNVERILRRGAAGPGRSAARRRSAAGRRCSPAGRRRPAGDHAPRQPPEIHRGGAMNLPTEVFGDVAVVHAPDELGEEQASPLLGFCAGLPQSRIVLDLDGTESLGSAGLTALLDAQDRLRGN